MADRDEDRAQPSVGNVTLLWLVALYLALLEGLYIGARALIDRWFY